MEAPQMCPQPVRLGTFGLGRFVTAAAPLWGRAQGRMGAEEPPPKQSRLFNCLSQTVA